MKSMGPLLIPQWAAELVGLTPEDRTLPADLPGVNLALNRLRLARFLAEFAKDGDVRDLLLLDLLGVAIDAPVSSTGTVEDIPTLAQRPFRLWEYAWLYKGLELDAGGLDVLDLGGPASPLVILAALAGNRVVSVDINPTIIAAARTCVKSLNLKSLEPRVGDMRDLSGFPAKSFDVIMCCSVLEHLTAEDQERSLRKMARLLRPGGRIGLTFDYGLPAPGANEHLPPPHEPPESAVEVVRRYAQAGLAVLGNVMPDEPIPGSLFHDDVVRYVMGALFLGKPPLKDIELPRSKPGKRSALSSLVAGRVQERLNKHSARLAARLHHASEAESGLRKNIETMQGIAAERLAALEAASAEISRAQAALERRAADLERAAAEVNTSRAARSRRKERHAIAPVHEDGIRIPQNLQPTGAIPLMGRRYQPPLPGLANALEIAANTGAFLSKGFQDNTSGAERACLDRYLIILDSLERRSLFDSSLLDIGCSNGFFAYLFAVTICRHVTAVEDMRGASAGYSENAFLNPLLQIKQEYALSHLEVIDAPIEQFLKACPDRQWDIVLCLSVLHHLYTGYGDNPEVGLLQEEARRWLFAAIGRATGSVLYLEFDHGRVPDGFLSEFKDIGGFAGSMIVGSSASAVGETRNIYEVWK